MVKGARLRGLWSAQGRVSHAWEPYGSECQHSLTHVVVFVLWSMKKGRPLGAILISQPGGRKLCVTLCCGLGEL